jgi:hypothetical protein
MTYVPMDSIAVDILPTPDSVSVIDRHDSGEMRVRIECVMTKDEFERFCAYYSLTADDDDEEAL